MRRAFYASVAIAVLALGLVCCWLGSRQDPKQPQDVLSAAAQAVDRIPEATETSATPAIASRDVGIDAGRLVGDKEPFIVRLHALVTRNSRLAESLARDDREHFPNSPDADERDALLVAALYNQGDIDRARHEAHYYFARHPSGRFTEYLSKLMGLRSPAGATRPAAR
jgi:hypothetical protein